MRWTRSVLLIIAIAMTPAIVSFARANETMLGLKSSAVLVFDLESSRVLYGKNTQSVMPIASITKLMTAMVTLDANLEPDELITITEADIDTLKGTHSRMIVGAELSRDELLRLALMASENRAASALGRSYPGGLAAFVEAMNDKAARLGMSGSRFSDPTGLSSANVSTAEDLTRLVHAAHGYPKIREYSTTPAHDVRVGRRLLHFRNTNRLLSSTGWDIGLSKTGFINEAGRCLVMQARMAGRAVIIVLLDSLGKYGRLADATRIRQWLDPSTVRHAPRPAATRFKKSRRGSYHIKNHIKTSPKSARPV